MTRFAAKRKAICCITQPGSTDEIRRNRAHSSYDRPSARPSASPSARPPSSAADYTAFRIRPGSITAAAAAATAVSAAAAALLRPDSPCALRPPTVRNSRPVVLCARGRVSLARRHYLASVRTIRVRRHPYGPPRVITYNFNLNS